MAEYLSPGVYVESVQGKLALQGVSSSTGGMIGITQRGKIGKAIFLSSWDAYLREFATGVDSPFMADSDVAYAVYGFFQNGGRRIYLTRAASPTAKKSQLKADSFVVPSTEDVPDYIEPTIEAKDEGLWGDKLKIFSVKNEDIDGTYNVTVGVGEDILESYTALSNDPNANYYWIDTINSRTGLLNVISGYLSETPVTTSGTQQVVQAATFEGGSDGIDDIVDDDYIQCLTSFDKIDDITLLAIPGQTSKAIIDAVLTYVDLNKYMYAILDAPRTADLDTVRALRKQISSQFAGLYYPWIKVNDPLSRAGISREVPTAGHVMGVYARIIAERGVWKAPAGTEAVVRGALDVVTTLTTSDTDVLNPAGIISIYPKTNYGIVIWGARSISPDTSKLYVSDILLDIYIRKSIYNGTQPFVFEPNNQKLWTRVEATVEAFLNVLWLEGGLFGNSPAEAYYVRCDEELNPEPSRNQGKLICEVGYAGSKPAEFVIFRVSHQMPRN